MTNALKKIAKLVPPERDKGWSFQVINVTEDDVWTVRSKFSDPAVEAAKPFLQGNSGGWVMVEFFKQDKALIDAAAAVMFKAFHLPVVVGPFTRQDIGLD